MKSNFCFTYFSFIRDYSLLKNSIESLKFWFPESPIFVVDDFQNPMTKEQIFHIKFLGAQYRTSKFKRCGNLNGEECICGILDEMKLSADLCKSDISFKIDCDTFLFNDSIKKEVLKRRNKSVFLRRLDGRKSIEEGEVENFETGFGMFYGLPSNKINDIKEEFMRDKSLESRIPSPILEGNEYLPEDICITYACFKVIGESGITLLDLYDKFFLGWRGNETPLSECSKMGIVHFGQRCFGTQREIETKMFQSLKLLYRRRGKRNG